MRISDWSSDVCSSDLLVWFPSALSIIIDRKQQGRFCERVTAFEIAPRNIQIILSKSDSCYQIFPQNGRIRAMIAQVDFDPGGQVACHIMSVQIGRAHV